MSKIGISTNYVLLITILVLSTSFAKPTSPEENSDNDEYTKLLNAERAAKSICGKKYRKDMFSSGEGVKIIQENDEFCYQRCITEKMGFMKNNEIDLDKILKLFKMMEKSGRGNQLSSGENLKILTDCVKKTNSKHLEGYCDPIKDVMQCIDNATA